MCGDGIEPVGSKPAGASPYGALDMFGNVWEWTADLRIEDWEEMRGERRGAMIFDPHTGTLGIHVAVRGSSYYFDIRGEPASERMSFRPEERRKTVGFRCATSD